MPAGGLFLPKTEHERSFQIVQPAIVFSVFLQSEKPAALARAFLILVVATHTYEVIYYLLKFRQQWQLLLRW